MMLRTLPIISLLIFGLIECLNHKSQAQDAWKPIDLVKDGESTLIWEPVIEPEKLLIYEENWETIPEVKEADQPSTVIIWEPIKAEDETTITTSKKESDSILSRPSSFEEAEALIKIIPLQSNDFKPLLNLSHAVPTASVLSQEEWSLIATTTSPFKFSSGTGNQNYAIRLNYGLSNTLQISGFYSEADDPLNNKIRDFDTRPGNLWEVFGAATRWKFLTNKNWSLALNGSLERWIVGSGGSDSFSKNSGENASPNIFNDSGRRVETQNLVGSISLPFTSHAYKKWQFTFTPGISFLPSSQGKGQGGAGEFYGTNPYISGGFLWHPIPEIGLTTSVAQPLGTGTNSFNKNLRYSRATIFSGGLNWHLNPRIALQGHLTNGFGLTPATSLLTLPSDNRLGYSAKIVLNPDAADTPQPPLSRRQRALSFGGLSVNTALVPPDATSIVKISSDIKGNFGATIGHSISNIFHIDFHRSKSNNIPQSTAQARTYLNDDGINWRGSGKAVLTSPLRGAPIWSALRMSFGRNVDTVNKSSQGYLFAETPITWEANPKFAVNLNPKFAWSGIGNLVGIGISTNIQLAPSWQLIPEVNIVINDQKSSNGTLGLRWNAAPDIAIEAYGSTASSIIDIGQLLSAEEVRWGGRLVIQL